MSWLATLDAKSRTWPAVARWPYLWLKWFLIAMGAYAAIFLAYTEVIKEHRIGLGSGIVVAGLLALIKGIVMAFTSTSPSPPHPTDPKSS